MYGDFDDVRPLEDSDMGLNLSICLSNKPEIHLSLYQKHYLNFENLEHPLVKENYEDEG